MGTITSLDLLQNNGIINFDAEAYIKGETPKTANNQAVQIQTPAMRELKNDIYTATKTEKRPASWKKYLSAGLALGLVLLITLRGKLNPKNWKIFKK